MRYCKIFFKKFLVNAFCDQQHIDLSAFAIAGMSVTVPNGHEEVRRRAHLVTQSMGGRGAVREVCDIAKADKSGQSSPIYKQSDGKILNCAHASRSAEPLSSRPWKNVCLI
jgi:regulator of sirC expression with transglutaminase-like and TPR domain